MSSIFEPQLVRTPWVQNRSLWAIGAPSRAPFSPLARRSSAALAWAMARSSVMLMKLLSLGIQLPDATEQGAGQLFGGKLLVGEGAGDLGEGQLMQHVSASL